MGQLKTYIKRITSNKYIYDDSRYEKSFVSTRPKQCDFDSTREIPRKVYCCWTGDNEMSPDRAKAFKTLCKVIGVEVVLVTPKILSLFILPDYPLHKSFPYLSLVHKSDYLRCYLMHHHGGGYADIKFFGKSWTHAFNLLASNPEKWVLGYREIGKRGAALVENNMGVDLKKYWHLLLGNGSFICRPQNPFTQEWYNELHARLDYFHDKLVQYPGDAFGKNPGYPIPWTYIMGHIFHPLCLKYNDKLLYSNSLKFIPLSYR